MNTDIKDFETWLQDNSNKIFRWWKYKRMFTPYEQEMKFEDQSDLEEDECSYGYFKEAIRLPDGDILIGIQATDIDREFIQYEKLSNIDFMFCESDMNEDS